MKIFTKSRKGKPVFVSIINNSVDVSVWYVHHDTN